MFILMSPLPADVMNSNYAQGNYAEGEYLVILTETVQIYGTMAH